MKVTLAAGHRLVTFDGAFAQFGVDVLRLA